MNTLDQIMLYVVDQERIARFWVDHFGFSIAGRQDYGATFAIELVDGRGGSSKLVLQNKTAVAAAEPGMNLGTPSILLGSDELEGLYGRLKAAGVTVGELVAFPNNGKKVFNFADPEGNYFAIMGS
jgi:lactoylglutathione lyase